MSAASDKRMQEIADKFKRDMEKLGVGVSIKIAGEPEVVIVESPTPSAANGETP